MIRVAVNGFGRIGRSFLRTWALSSLSERMQVVAINELATPEAMHHLLAYDSTHGRFQGEMRLDGQTLWINGQAIELLHEPEPKRLPWKKLNVDLVIEATGVLKTRTDCEQHVQAGAKKVLISHPATQDVDATVVYGVNDHLLRAEMTVVSNASCTTNCCVPVIHALHQAFEVERGAMTTIHSYMNDQQVIDSYHQDLRLTRAAGQSIIPVTTKLAQGVERILPELKNKFEAIAVRVPTMNVTAMDVCLTLKNEVTAEQINQTLQAVATAKPEIMGVTFAPLVSIDFNNDSRSVVVDATQTCVSDGHLVKLLLWCDNEWGYAHRLLDTASTWFQESKKG
jgi:D-erythrose 4-phosphate dehydrogenase